jgi:hypothetical protein
MYGSSHTSCSLQGGQLSKALLLSLEMESAAADDDDSGGHESSSAAHIGFDVSASQREQRWDSLLGINPAAWWASLRRTPQLLRERAFRTRTLAGALEVGASP